MLAAARSFLSLFVDSQCTRLPESRGSARGTLCPIDCASHDRRSQAACPAAGSGRHSLSSGLVGRHRFRAAAAGVAGLRRACTSGVCTSTEGADLELPCCGGAMLAMTLEARLCFTASVPGSHRPGVAQAAQRLQHDEARCGRSWHPARRRSRGDLRCHRAGDGRRNDASGAARPARRVERLR
jgi:hypothetical protein